MKKPNIKEYMTSDEITCWAMANLNIVKLQDALTDFDIRRIIRWVGLCSIDTIFIDGDKPILGRIGIGLMLSVTLMEFSEFYSRYGLSQFN
jgi:hypothetical protein